MKNYKFLLLILTVVVVVVAIQVYAASTYSVLRDPNGLPAKDGAPCTTTSSRPTVGHQLSTRVLANSTTRAWTRIQVADLATTSSFVSLVQDARATTADFALNIANQNGGASSTPSIDFGIATELPYTGSVNVITNYGSTTILVFECNY